MSDKVKSTTIELEIAHILFIDTVGYSKLPIHQQRELQAALNRIVRGTDCFQHAEASGKLVRLPTGDGMALVFADNIETPLKCASQIAEALKEHPDMRIRMGIHNGPISRLADVNDRTNIAGAGVNVAERVMSCGDAGHILLSKHIADDLAFYTRWQSHLHDIGECEVKHGVKLHLVNFYTDRVGNPQLPRHLRESREKHAATARRKFRLRLLATAAALLAAIVAITLFQMRGSNPDTSHSVAVLPFRDFSQARDQEYFSDGIAEQIINSLAQIKGLLVVARTSSFAFKDKDEDVRVIGRRLRVGYLIEGSVSRVSGKIRVAAQLINVANGYHLWSKNYDSNDGDLLSLQSNVAQKVADAFQSELHLTETKPVEKPLTANTEASEWYLRGRYQLNKRTTESIKKAREFFERAIGRDPYFALAHAGVADAYILLAEYGELASTEASRLAWPEISAALKADDNLSEAHASRAMLLAHFDWNWPAADLEYQKAIELNPNNSKAHHWYALHLAETGRSNEAIEQIDLAKKLDPLSPIIRAAKGKILFVAHRYDQAIDQCQAALDLEPDFSPALDVMGQIYGSQKKVSEAIAVATKSAKISNEDPDPLALAYAYATAGQKEEADRLVRQVTHGPTPFAPYDMATVCAGAHDEECALRWLSTAIDRHSLSVVWTRVDPRLDNIRASPRFRDQIARLTPRASPGH